MCWGNIVTVIKWLSSNDDYNTEQNIQKRVVPTITERQFIMLSAEAPVGHSHHLFPDRLSAPIITRRKFSFPANLHSTVLHGDPPGSFNAGSLQPSSTASSARRRLSNVSDVVTRKLSSTIGWKQPVLPSQDIITQGKCLCGQYIRCRLKKSGVFNRKLGLQRIRSIVGTPTIHVVREVFPALLSVGEELERMYPRVYNGVARQLSRIGRGELKTPETAPVLLSAIARDLFRSDITWGKVVSLFAIAGGLSVDCVRQGHPDYLPKLIEGVADVIEDELVTWISENGGWVGLANKVRPPQEEVTFAGRCFVGAGLVVCLFVFVLLLKALGIYMFPKIFT
ncbi:uncharacterized protein LOC134220942 isoform X2 [Armigeres subalbatus]|uniref:uncharacterized protein LOC134220942 isoform X2 n=1 Tax=Armigeres subalbatus TaxID=124917 RepID=UPI002ED380F7